MGGLLARGGILADLVVEEATVLRGGGGGGGPLWLECCSDICPSRRPRTRPGFLLGRFFSPSIWRFVGCGLELLLWGCITLCA